MKEKRVSVIFFIDENRYRYNLDEINRNIWNGQISGSLFEKADDVSFPFITTDDGIFVDKKTFGQIEVVLIGNNSKHVAVQHGNLYQIRNYMRKQVYYVFFLERNDMDIQFDRFILPVHESVCVGRNSSNHIQYDVSNIVSRENQLILQNSGNGRIYMNVSDNSGSLVFVNDKLYQGNGVRIGDEIQYLGLTILCIDGGIAVSRQDVRCQGMRPMDDPMIHVEKVNSGNQFNRTFRLSDHPLRHSQFEIDPPPAVKEEEQIPLLLSIGPSFTMAMAMMVSAGISVSNAIKGGNIATVATGCSMAVCMLLAAAFWPVMLRKHRRKKIRVYNAAREEKYRQYVKGKEEAILQEEEYNRQILDRYSYPAPETQMSFLLGEKIHRLWERSKNDQDFLVVRLGKGAMQNLSSIKIPPKKFSMQSDDLMNLPGEVAEEHKMLNDVPITISLKENHRVGLVGKQSEMFDLIQLIILNMIALHAPDEVKIAFVGTEKKISKMSWIERIPHIWNWNRTRRLIAVNQEESLKLHSEIYERMNLREEYYIIVIMDSELIRGIQWKQLIAKEEDTGSSCIFAYGDYYTLPQSCNLLIQWGYKECFVQKKNGQIRIEKDLFPWERIQEFMSVISLMTLASGVEVKPIPDVITYLQMYKVGNVHELEIEKRWKMSDAGSSLAVPVGMGTDGELINLDIHEHFHGCHGLVAGMTGAGKSEFLQAYITSLMIQFSPEDIAFVLIDFKGGDMARPYLDSPYLSATISNLTDNILRRALVSLRAEIRERELLFNDVARELGTGKMDINLYIRYYKEGKVSKAIPHLFIIVDEFAQLKKQNTAFLDELVNIAQVGRSIGIHLILATQKPAGIVDPQINSNSRFRICLKVQSKQDSSDMIEGPEAAAIKQAGRFYMMVGNRELFLEAQSGYAGCTYMETDGFSDEDNRKVSMVDHLGTSLREAVDTTSQRRMDMTQMEAVLTEIKKIAAQKKLTVDALWKPELEEILYADHNEFPESYDQHAMPVPLGMGDFVRERIQETIYADLLVNGHIAVCGLSESGKTTLIQTILWGMAYRYSPKRWNLYYLDLSGKSSEYYRRMPHCRQVVFDANDEEIAALLQHLTEHMEERKILFAETGCNTYREYIKNSGNELPALVLVVDNYSPFRERYYRLEEKIVELVSSGKTYGIYLILTGNSKSAIYYKVMEHISQIFLLQMNDVSAYQIILNTGRDIVTPEPVKGRGICRTDRGIVEFQTFLICKAEHEAQRRQILIRDICNRYPEQREERPARSVRHPDEPVVESMHSVYKQNLFDIERPEVLHGNEAALIAGYSLSGKLKYGILLSELHHFLIAGGVGEQKLQLMLSVIDHLLNISGAAVTVADFGKRMKSYRSYLSECQWIDDEAAFDAWLQKVYKTWKKQDNHSAKQILIITDFREFFDAVSNQSADWLREICRDSNQTRFHVITSAVLDKNLSMYNVDELYEYLIKTRSGLLCDGVIAKDMYVYLHTQLKEILLTYEGKKYVGEKALFFHEGKAVEVNVR